jgi:membrane-bound ClpP family serine protease
MNVVTLLLTIVTVGLVTLELFLPRGHHPPGWHAAVGLISCVVGVLVSKALGRAFLQRAERPDDA